jgi:hypothetical protein
MGGRSSETFELGEEKKENKLLAIASEGREGITQAQ